MAFRFSKYDSGELRMCAEAFIEHFSRCTCTNAAEWTLKVHNWLAGTAAPGVEPIYRGTGCSELLVDLCHATFPKEIDGFCPQHHHRWWTAACDLGQVNQIYLAVESEWGKYNSAGIALRETLYDARKVAMVRATAKAILFASQSKQNRQDIVYMLERLRNSTGDQSPWLWIDGACSYLSAKPREFDFGIFD